MTASVVKVRLNERRSKDERMRQDLRDLVSQKLELHVVVARLRNECSESIRGIVSSLHQQGAATWQVEERNPGTSDFDPELARFHLQQLSRALRKEIEHCEQEAVRRRELDERSFRNVLRNSLQSTLRTAALTNDVHNDIPLGQILRVEELCVALANGVREARTSRNESSVMMEGSNETDGEYALCSSLRYEEDVERKILMCAEWSAWMSICHRSRVLLVHDSEALSDNERRLCRQGQQLVAEIDRLKTVVAHSELLQEYRRLECQLQEYQRAHLQPTVQKCHYPPQDAAGISTLVENPASVANRLSGMVARMETFVSTVATLRLRELPCEAAGVNVTTEN